MTHEEILTTLGHYVDHLIAGSTAEAPLWNIEKVRSGKPNKWNYIDGCMITACLSLYKTTGDEKFLDFSKKFLDYFVKDNGVIETYDPAEYNLDNINQGKNLFTLYDLTGNQRYRDAIETIRGQLETQPRTKEGNFWHLLYPVKETGEMLELATTRPETMLGDTAVAINAADPRYAHLHGCHVMLPLANREIPIICDEHADMEKGTGVVKITPAHDPNDNEVGQRHNLPVVRVFTYDGHMTGAEDAAARAALIETNYACKPAIVMLLLGVDKTGAETLLTRANGRVAAALEG